MRAGLTIVLGALTACTTALRSGAHRDDEPPQPTVVDQTISVTVDLPQNPSLQIVSLTDDDLAQYNDLLPSDPLDPTYTYQLFVAAIAKTQATGAAVLDIPFATYTIEKPASADVTAPGVDLSALQDVIVDGNGSTLVFMDIAEGLLVSRKALRLWIRNLILDWGVPLVYPGDFTLDNGGTPMFRPRAVVPVDPTQPPVLTVVTEFDLDDRDWVHAPPLLNIRHVTTNTHLTGAAPTYDAGKAAFYFDDADAMTIKAALATAAMPSIPGIGTIRTTHHAVDIAGQASQITLDHVTVYTSPAMAFIIRGIGKGFHLFHVADIRSPDPTRYISSLADAVNVGTAGDIIIEESEFANQEDDGLNLHAQFFAVSATAVSGDSTIVSMTASYDPNYQSGDTVALVSASDFSTVLQGDVTAFAACSSGAGCDYEVTLAATPTSSPPTDGLFVINLSNAGSNFIVRNNSYHDSHANGIKIQGRNGIVDGNDVRYVVDNGLLLQADLAYWLEGPGPQDVTVTGNSISDVGFSYKTNALSFLTCGSSDLLGYEAALQVGARLPSTSGTYGGGRPLKNLHIDGNTIAEVNGLAVLVATADAVTVTDNVVTDANLTAFATVGAPSCVGPVASGSILVTDADTVTLTGNSRTGLTTQGISIDSSSTSEVTGQADY